MVTKTRKQLIKTIKELSDTIVSLVADNEEKENLINVLMAEPKNKVDP